MAVSLSLPTNSTFHLPVNACTSSKADISLSAFIIIRSLLVFPFSTWVLHLGYQRWRQQGSFASMTPSDLITCHMAVMQLTGVPGIAIYFCGLYVPYMYYVGLYVSTVSIFGELLLHVVTCVERYLAIVHPITYLGLKSTKGTRIRKICVGGIWLSFFGWCSMTILRSPNFPIISILCIMSLSFAVVSFCSLAALWVLIRPGPGAVVADRERVDPSKRKAFHTIVVIAAVLWLFFIGHTICVVLQASALLDDSVECLVLTSGIWFSLPSSLMAPLLFLHRSGKLPAGCPRTD